MLIIEKNFMPLVTVNIYYAVIFDLQNFVINAVIKIKAFVIVVSLCILFKIIIYSIQVSVLTSFLFYVRLLAVPLSFQKDI